MANGKIGVSTKDLFPIIKKFLYSDHDIFLREIVSNAVDASQKLKVIAQRGEYNGDVSDLKVRVKVDKDAKTITVSDNGIGMTREEVEKYINQIAFSGAEEFLEKHKDDAATIIGHFGMGFYSAFMVSDKVEILTKSYKEGAQAVRWQCTGDPEYTLDDDNRDERGTDIIMHISEEEKEFLDEKKIEDLLNKYCKFLPIPIVYGKKKEWKDGKYVDTDADNVINDTEPAWTKKPASLKDEDYEKFYRQLYPMAEEPLFHIHLNVDYPFTLTGILYFPKIKNNVELSRNKIQLYCNQVFVTDSVEGIVPDFLTLLHGVIDSPDIPLNVSRSYLQSDSNVKKIASHITKKVADQLEDIFKNDRATFEQKWDDLKIFIQYGLLTDEKFAERAQKFMLFKNIDGKYYTLDEYKELIKANQTDKDGTLVYLYANNKDAQYSASETAKQKGYDVLLMDGQLDTPVMNQFEQKWEKSRFSRVDADVIDKLIPKENANELQLTTHQKSELEETFRAELPTIEKTNFNVSVEALGASAMPVLITQNEWMRRMKEMSQIQGGMMSFYGEMPDTFNIVVNADHPLVANILANEESANKEQLAPIYSDIEASEARKNELNKAKEGKKDEEIPQADKDALADVEKKLNELSTKRVSIISQFAHTQKQISQLIDLALLQNGMLSGEKLAQFVKRSIDLMK
ncbi:MAG: molecular chaperone HtpG [Bacteroidales bacterium]|jgi:molecular chaperone HtpG|nr:molecular chaperone HtpG [Bacteroidales bacterium]